MFATWIDWVFFMVPGFCSSIIVGCALPLAMLVFGLVTNSLINIQVCFLTNIVLTIIMNISPDHSKHSSWLG